VQKAKQLGFDDYAINCIEGPKDVLNFLRSVNLHHRPIAMKEISQQALKEIENDDRFVSGFVSGNSIYSIKRSYGVHSTNIQKVRNAQYLIDSVDADYQRSLEAEAHEIQEKMTRNESQYKDLNVKITKLKGKFGPFDEKKVTLVNSKKQYMELYKTYRKITEIIKKRGCDIDIFRQNASRFTDKIEEIEDGLNLEINTRIKQSSILCEVQLDCSMVFQERTVASLNKIKCEAKASTIKYRLEHESDAVRQAKLEYETKKYAFKQLKAAATASQNKLKAHKTQCSGSLLLIFDQEIEQSIEQLDESLAQQQARAELAAGINPSILVDYNTRKKLIEQTEIKYHSLIVDADELRASFQQIKDTWTSRLRNVVESISTSFSDLFDRMTLITGRYWLRWRN
jgi:chromosome segregation ATPase